MTWEVFAFDVQDLQRLRTGTFENSEVRTSVEDLYCGNK